MNGSIPAVKNGTGQSFFLSEILGARINSKGKKIGSLEDLVIMDGEYVAEVSHLYVSRPFGDPALAIPWNRVQSFKRRAIDVDIASVDDYVVDVKKPLLLLKDHVVDKKILDVEGKEVEVVYDSKLLIANNKMYVTDVDMSHYGLLRRMGLKGLAEFISNLGDALKAHTISWKYVQPLPPQISSFEGNIKLRVLKEKITAMHPVDAADVLEELDPEQRVAVFRDLDTERASETLEEIDPVVQKALLGALSDEKIAQLINEMTPGQGADVLSVLPSPRAITILKLVETGKAVKIQAILEKHEEKILNFATQHFLKIRPKDTVEQARELYRTSAKGKDVIMYFYVVDENDRLLGVADIRDVLKAEDNALMESVMDNHLTTLNSSSTMREASAMFSRYGYRALPITDEKGRILGVVPYRDMMNLKHLFLE